MKSMKRALVTGAGGFLGRHMVDELRSRGWEVSTIWDLAYGADVMNLFTSSHYDGTPPPYDLVVHAAYHVGGRAGIDGLNTNFAKNVALDGAMFDWAVRTGQHRVLYFSSSAVYPVEYQTGGAGGVTLDEDAIDLSHPRPPDAGYGWAKLTGEHLAASARRAGLPVTVVRPFSGYSPTQGEEYPFPAIVDRAIADQHYVWGPKGQTRDWIHVHDVVNAALAVVDSGTEDPVNLCTGIPTTMDGLLREAVRQLHSMHPDSYPHADEIDVKHLVDKPTGVFYRVGDPTRMLKYYTPVVTLTQGIRGALIRRGAMRVWPNLK